MAKQQHRLEYKDVTSMMGVCPTCGPVGLLQVARGVYRCKKSVQLTKKLYNYKKRYGAHLTAEDIAEECEVCGSTERVSYDHCHNTGNFRGWLCSRCNSALGYAKDNPSTLRKLADYLDACG